MIALDTYINNDKMFFNKSSFFDNNVKKKVESKSKVNFEELVEWCSTQCYTKPQNIKYIGEANYVKFFLFFVYRNKEILEQLWLVVAGYVDKRYKIRLVDNDKQFKQYLWELYLKYYLLKKGFVIENNSNNIGPDVLFNYRGQNIYIECTVPMVGNNDFKVPAMEINGCGPIPFEQLKCRLKYSIHAKINKYKEYISKGKVSPNEKLIIALNTSDLDLYSNFMDAKGLLLLEVCSENHIFENNSFLDGVIYNHKSIFEGDETFMIYYLQKDYTVLTDSINI